jgi:predicted nucleic acid-binding protein
VGLAYFDSSALVKLVVDEAGSEVAAAVWNACDAAVSSRVAHPEVCAALAAAGRNHDLTRSEVASATAEWAEFWASMRPVELSREVERSAGSLAGELGLRGADAVHLASALALGLGDLIFVAWDRRLRAAAAVVGLALAPAEPARRPGRQQP